MSSCKEILLSWGDLFVGILVFVIFTFFKEGIGNNLTMPFIGVLGLGNGSWDLGLRGRELVTLVTGSLWVLNLECSIPKQNTL